VKDKIIQKYDRAEMYFIAFTNASDGSLRAEFAAENESERDKWFNVLSFACQNIEKCVKFDKVIGTGQFASVRKATSK